MAIRVYEYGLLQPTSNQDLAIEQLRLANHYYNDLIEIEMNRRKAYSMVLEESSGGVLDATKEALKSAFARLEVLRKEIKALKGKKDNVSKEASGRLKSEAKEVSATIDPLKLELKRLKQFVSSDPVFAAKKLEIQERAVVLNKATRARSKAYWGTRGSIDAFVKQASKAPVLKFRRFDGSGLLVVQLQKDSEGNTAVSADDLFGMNDNRVQILPSGSETKAKHLLRLRISSTSKKDPIWGEWPMILHRPFPEGSRIRFVKVIRRRMATWFRWYVQFTVDVPDVQKKDPTSRIAVDLGWRSGGDNTLRVAYVGDAQGNTQEIVVPARIRNGLNKADSIRSIRDKLLDDLRTSLLSAFTPEALGVLPKELREKILYLRLWKAPTRFVFLHRALKELPEAELVSIKAELAAWYQRDRHLFQYETNLREKTLRARREIYRLVASQLAKKYAVLVLEDFKLTEVIEAPEPEDEKVKTNKQLEIDNKVANQRFHASPGLLRNCLMNAFEREGGAVIKVEAKGTTRTCHLCGYDKPWKNKAEKMHTCEGCRIRWDRDDNAYRNILKRGEAMLAVGLVPKIKREAAFAKRHKVLAAKAAERNTRASEQRKEPEALAVG